MKNNSEEYFTNNGDQEMTVCVSCLAPNQISAVICEECGALLNVNSNLDPMKTIRAESFLLQKATTQRPKLIVLFGVWILFFPWFLANLYLALYVAAYSTGLGGFFFFWAGIALTLLTGRIVYVVTKNYFTMPDGRHGEQIGAEHIAESL